MAAAHLLNALKEKQPESIARQREHLSILIKLTNISNNPLPSNSQIPRVNKFHTLLTDPTLPAILRTMKRIHQRCTHTNTPFQPYPEGREKQKKKMSTIKANKI